MLLALFGFLCSEFEEAGAIAFATLLIILVLFMMMVSKVVKWKYFEGK